MEAHPEVRYVHSTLYTYVKVTILGDPGADSGGEGKSKRAGKSGTTLFTSYQVKLKESMYIKWEKPDLNQQVKHINLTLSLEMRARASVNFVSFKFM